MAGQPERVGVQELRCDNCGAPWEMRGFLNTRTRACENCGSVFQGRGEQWELIQRVEGSYQARPAYALGTRGRLDGVEWEVVGWAERSVTAWGVRYAWEEHLLFNPYEGFRYLMLSDGHWAVVSPLPGVPTTGMNQAVYGERTFKHFQSAEAVVDEVLGEFPWLLKRGDVALASDYVDPPFLLSCEGEAGRDAAEINWSSGRYLEREEMEAAFGAPTRRIGEPHGIHPCQPNPHGALKAWMQKALLVGVVAWLVLSLLYFGTRRSSVVWKGAVTTAGASASDVVIDSFSDPSTIEVEAIAPDLNNQWIYLDCMLIDPKSERASYLGVEVEYWSGPGWSEGSRSGSTTVAGVPNGTYLIQVTPDPNATYKGTTVIQIKRDVRLWRYPCCSLLLVLLIPLVVFVRSQSFERMRWAESDHPMG
ncbi:MAG: DUF4178 domain-containing protein [Planctomycetota bacterium]